MKLGLRNIRTKPGKSNMLVGGKKVIMIMMIIMIMIMIMAKMI